MKYLKIFIITVISVFLLASCWSAEEPKNVSNSAGENANIYNSQENENSDRSENEPKDENEAADEVPKIETFDPPANKELTPTETLKTFNLASLNKNPERIKSLITKGSIHLITQRAKDEGLSFDEMIKSGKGVPAFETTQIRSEKISGETASVEIKFEDRDGFDTVPFVKEDGKWKIDFVKFFKDIITQTNS